MSETVPELPLPEEVDAGQILPNGFRDRNDYTPGTANPNADLAAKEPDGTWDF
ncbi:hypothetical protein KDA23_06450 [Candidatus Saccharibacteria bacterium]|nr:hypothetical protein [Candidatus Saccharibacteria bacterium]